MYKVLLTVFCAIVLCFSAANDACGQSMSSSDAHVSQGRSSIVLGSNLFGQQCKHFPDFHFQDPNYIITAGDKIAVQLWGAVTLNQSETVDQNGNIFLPNIGPIMVGGVSSSQLDKVIKINLSKAYKKDVYGYAHLLTSQPVQIYVTGQVKFPGLYNGISSDSILQFLCKAGGINSNGSYRDVRLMRSGRIVTQYDLYSFILTGKIAGFPLHQGDTIFVTPVKNTITVTLDKTASQPLRRVSVEFQGSSVSIHQLMHDLSIKDDDYTYVKVIYANKASLASHYLPLAQSGSVRVGENDQVEFIEDQTNPQITITVDGAVRGAHTFILPEGATLSSLVKKLKFKSGSNINAIQVFRPSVAKVQKKNINRSLNMLSKAVLTPSINTAEGAQMSQVQARLAAQYIAEARKVKPKGQVVLGSRSMWQHFMLKNNDVIHVPEQSSVVNIGGEVLIPKSIQYSPTYSFQDYLMAAGGFTQQANRRGVLVVYPNGAVRVVRYDTSLPISGGDQIMVLPRPFSDNLAVAALFSQLVYQIAIATKVVL